MADVNTSLFSEIIDKYFHPIVSKVTEYFNDSKKEPNLLYPTMLQEEYSADLTWDTASFNNSIVAADVVSMDSPLPLKKRSTLSLATGKIPKMGIAFYMGEKVISDINIMGLRGANEAQIASKVLNDVPRAVKGIYYRNEILFEQGLSTGEVLVPSDENTGVGVRVRFGYKSENMFHALIAKWGDAGYTPCDDIRQMFDKADEDGNTIAAVMMSKKYFDLLRHSEQGKLLAANYLKLVFSTTANLPVPSNGTMIAALADEYNAQFIVVNNTFRTEAADGSKKKVCAWEEANVVAIPSTNVGRLFYGTLVEESKPVNGVDYQKSGTYILVSKYSENNPYKEYTTAQSISLPVIDNADQIYVLHADALSSALSVTPATMAFTSKSYSKTANIHCESDVAKLTAESSAEFATATLSANHLTIKVAANTGVARTATVTITDENSNTATIAVSQEANA